MQDQKHERHHEPIEKFPRLCIVSRERALRWGELMVALRQTLSPQDELKIIIDRRSGRPSTDAPPESGDRPGVERRRHPHVDVVLRVDGFAIVPASASGGPPAHRPTSPYPIQTSLLDDADVEDVEQSVAERSAVEQGVDDAEPPRRTETPARALSPHSPKSSSPDGPGDEPLDDEDPEEAPARAPSLRFPNPRIQRLFAEEPRDEPLDDAAVDDSEGGVDEAEPRPRSDRGPRFPQRRIPSPRTSGPRVPRSWLRHEPFDDDDDDEPQHSRSRSIWVVTGLVALIVLLALLVVGQTIEAFKVRIEPPRSALATRPVPDQPSADQTRQPSADQPSQARTAPPDPAPDSGTDKPASVTPSPETELARKAEPAPAEGSRAPTPPPELPARRSPQPTAEAGAEPKRQARSSATTPPSTANTPPPLTVGRPVAASRTFSGVPRVELTRSPSSGSGATYIVRISDTAGRALPEAEVSLVGHMADGSGLSIPLDPGPEAGTYHATIPQGRALRDLRVRIVTSDSRFEVPVTP